MFRLWFFKLSSPVNKSNKILNFFRNIIFIETWHSLSGWHGTNHGEWIVTEKVYRKRALPDLPRTWYWYQYRYSGTHAIEAECTNHPPSFTSQCSTGSYVKEIMTCGIQYIVCRMNDDYYPAVHTGTLGLGVTAKNCFEPICSWACIQRFSMCEGATWYTEHSVVRLTNIHESVDSSSVMDKIAVYHVLWVCRHM